MMDERTLHLLMQPVLIVDREGRILFCNDACEFTFGLRVRQILGLKFPEFLKLEPGFGENLKRITSVTMYREASFDTGKKKGFVRYALQPVKLDSGQSGLMVIFLDLTVERTLHAKYQNQLSVQKELTQELLDQRADLLLSRDIAERKVNQMHFLLEFYSGTRFVLNSDLIAEMFLKQVSQELGFLCGFYFARTESSEGPELRVVHDAGQDLSQPKASAKEVSALLKKAVMTAKASEPLSSYGPEEVVSEGLARVYQVLGADSVTNAVVMSLTRDKRVFVELHFVNYVHGERVDEMTFELLRYMVDPLRISFDNSMLYKASVVDELTQLYNFRYFRDRLKSEQEKSFRQGRQFGLLLLDLDHFKSVNDQHGHTVGDRVLREVADCIKRHLAPEHSAARYGGEELAVILPGLDHEQVRQLAETIRAAIAALEIEIHGQSVKVTTSIGGGMYESGATLDEFIAKVDEALYAAKTGGRNRVVLIENQHLSKAL